MDDDLQVLTLPYNNDLSTLYSQTNNNIAILLIFLQILLLISILLISFLVPINEEKIENYFGFRYSNPNANPNANPNLNSNPNPNHKFHDSYSLTIYCLITLWLIILTIGLYMRRVYYKRLRILGYYKHHRSVETLSAIPSLVLHKTNAFVLLLTTLLCANDNKVIEISSKIQLKPINCLQIVITIAFVIIIPFLLKWFYFEIRFRNDRNPPDIFCVEDPQHLVTSAGLNEIGVRPSSYLEDLLEKQADLIYNLKLQNTHLRQMLYKVTQRSTRESLQSS